MNLWKRVFISIILVFIFLATLQLIKFLEIPQTTVGYFVLFTSSILSLVLAIGILLITLVQFTSKKAKERERKIYELRGELEPLLTELFNTESTDPKIYETAEKLTYIFRQAANLLGIGKRVREIYKPNFKDRLVALRAQTDSIPKHHRGGVYLHQMRKDLYDGKIDDPVMVKAAFRFLGDMRPYGDVAKDIYVLLKRLL